MILIYFWIVIILSPVSPVKNRLSPVKIRLSGDLIRYKKYLFIYILNRVLLCKYYLYIKN